MGGGTSSYQEIEETDCILLWGSNARETHPIFFHHLLKGVKRGAKLYAIDPRRTGSAQWAEVWAGLDVGTDIALSNTVAREIICSGLANKEFIEHATTGFDAYRELVMQWTLERGERETGVPAAVIREMAHTYATAKRAIISGWILRAKMNSHSRAATCEGPNSIPIMTTTCGSSPARWKIANRCADSPEGTKE